MKQWQTSLIISLLFGITANTGAHSELAKAIDGFLSLAWAMLSLYQMFWVKE